MLILMTLEQSDNAAFDHFRGLPFAEDVFDQVKGICVNHFGLAPNSELYNLFLEVIAKRCVKTPRRRGDRTEVNIVQGLWELLAPDSVPEFDKPPATDLHSNLLQAQSTEIKSIASKHIPTHAQFTLRQQAGYLSRNGQRIPALYYSIQRQGYPAFGYVAHSPSYITTTTLEIINPKAFEPQYDLKTIEVGNGITVTLAQKILDGEDGWQPYHPIDNQQWT